ncbi:hypothetical protein GDO81_029315 [Engystomops pustulosus]|uniref:Uncharacterized protein n=1 Tax=Engystomops pustulosus TaxID=76066 RepID=A0AAV6YD83_ENGPU|nr:hypothetical protein GDO81_029315 [Engystomops pustulosus]
MFYISSSSFLPFPFPRLPHVTPVLSCIFTAVFSILISSSCPSFLLLQSFLFVLTSPLPIPPVLYYTLTAL